ncbi:SusC/RagA family TonB-linked outer membrane protein [Adhaeribacter aquaticus]|uniref:SusC/RagA family TonB-linked outer membrane protein n=1 Tax=Adhaeribacter aquaticus TaxID=299567 RepID=UPI00047B1DB7|nr:SusC/RagA family TonB-linked outer membrane protein [Adhaeribacter aquaticus]
MRKFLFLSLLFLSALLQEVMAQSRTITGRVTDAGNNEGLPGVTVLVKGTQSGTATDVNGAYSINVPQGGTTLVFSFIGYTTTERAIGNASTINIALAADARRLGEVVVTALGIERTKNELPYAAQSVGGEEVAQTRQQNFTNALSGRVAGVQVQQNNNLGGSTNVVIRGNKSIGGNNQALFVIDGVPIDNSTNNTTNQATGRGGYDYGNAAADINPDDIESMTVLKGAAATALYGSRAANGVVMITTKKGSKRQGIGVTVNTGANWGYLDKSTYTRFQKEYGRGYPFAEYSKTYPGFYDNDVNGDGTPDRVVVLNEDGSAGPRFDPNLMVYNWDSFDRNSPNFGKPTPWVAGKNDPTSFFTNTSGTSHSLAIDGASDKGYFKVNYGRNSNNGMLPNSNVTKNFVNFAASYKLVEKLTATTSLNYTETDGLGRYGTGYSGLNPNQGFRQWWGTDVDVKDQERAYLANRENVTWNPRAFNDLRPMFFDNPYFVRHESYNTDNRRRALGYLRLDYKLTDWLNIMGRASLDTYDEIREERFAVGSIGVPSYTRHNGRYSETNYDLMANVDRDFSEDFNFKATIGTNIRDTRTSMIRSTTNGGLVVPRLYSLSNSRNPLSPPVEEDTRLRVNGYFASATLGFRNLAFLDVASRIDQSSSLPAANRTYYYPSISGSFVFSELMPKNYLFSYGKIRANYAEVGNMARPLSVYNTYDLLAPFGSTSIASVNGTRRNPNLKPERTKSYEVGVEMSFLDARAGFDVTYYNANSVDQILNVPISRATGFNAMWINAGKVVNKGFEVSAFGSPIKTDAFSWTINANWTRNRSKVLDLGPIQNYQIAAFQGGVSLNAAVGEPFGVIKGAGFAKHENGQRLVGANGLYVSNRDANTNIGDINPDWIGGVSNTFKYKGVSLGFLIDMKKGGSVFSLDQAYGQYTGIPDNTVFNNDLGNPVRDPIVRNADGTYASNSGGTIVPGVLANGTPNTTRVEVYSAMGYTNPPEMFVYDASYVKLREATLGYSLPQSLVSRMKVFQGVDLSIYGRNLYIFHKNTPYSDPEEGMSAGTMSLGYQSGAYPTMRNVGFNVRLRF